MSHPSHPGAFFLPIFSWLGLSILDLGKARDRPTDGQTDDDHKRLMPRPMGH